MPPMRPSAAALLVMAGLLFAVTRGDEIPFEKHTIDLGASEPCAVADIDGDGRPDIVSGEFWYAAPQWTKHRFREIDTTGNYIDDFSDLPLDVNNDGRMDIVSVSWFSKKIWWNENPGKGSSSAAALWKEHVIDTGAPVEFAFLVDLDNDGQARELLPQFGDDKRPLAWYEAKSGSFVKHEISDRSYGHGIGVGDLNGDGRNDILTSKGWLEAPADPRAGRWTFHADYEVPGNLGFLYVLDINGDGRPDIVSSMAHDYGVFWLEHMSDGKFVKHVIDDSWSQAHALTLVDLNGDGQKDILTGKRFMAHNGRDPGEREPLGVYWYEYKKLPGADHKVEWIKHTIDYSTRTGGGMQIPAVDLNKDGAIDFLVAGKSGLFWFENRTRQRPSAQP